MVVKMRWQILVLVLAGTFSLAQAADEMSNSFDAAEAGHYDRAASIWKSLAEKGDPQAEFNLGLMYHSGLGLARNEGEAVKWYQKAAEDGYPQARVYMAVGYQEGWFGLPKDEKEAYYWRGTLGQGQ